MFQKSPTGRNERTKERRKERKKEKKESPGLGRATVVAFSHRRRRRRRRRRHQTGNDNYLSLDLPTNRQQIVIII